MLDPEVELLEVVVLVSLTVVVDSPAVVSAVEVVSAPVELLVAVAEDDVSVEAEVVESSVVPVVAGASSV